MRVKPFELSDEKLKAKARELYASIDEHKNFIMLDLDLCEEVGQELERRDYRVREVNNTLFIEKKL